MLHAAEKATGPLSALRKYLSTKYDMDNFLLQCSSKQM